MNAQAAEGERAYGLAQRTGRDSRIEQFTNHPAPQNRHAVLLATIRRGWLAWPAQVHQAPPAAR